MKGSENTQFMSSDTELLEKAANNKLNSQPETEEWQISGSPFKITREGSNQLNGKSKFFATWGNGKMTQDFGTMEEVLEWIENNYWNFLITVLTMAMDSRDLYKIDQMVKRQKANDGVNRATWMDAKMDEEVERLQREHTLHMEIERLKEEEAYKARVEQNMEFFTDNM